MLITVPVGLNGRGMHRAGKKTADKKTADKNDEGCDRVMVEHADFTLDARDRALLRAVLAGSALRQIAVARWQTDGEVRAELQQLLARIRSRRQPFPADRGQPARPI